MILTAHFAFSTTYHSLHQCFTQQSPLQTLLEVLIYFHQHSFHHMQLVVFQQSVGHAHQL